MAKSLTVQQFFSKFPDDDTCILHVMVEGEAIF